MIKKITAVALLSVVLFSCSTSNEVVSNGFFQKRKYNKGWYANKSTKVKTQKGENIKNVVLEEEVIAKNEELASAPKIKSISKEFTSNEVKTESKKQLFASNEIASAKSIVVVNSQENIISSEELKRVSEIAPVEIKEIKKEAGDTSSNGHPMLLLYLLAIFIPPVAVGLVTDWESTPTISNILWTLLCGIPGIIHAFIIIGRYR